MKMAVLGGLMVAGATWLGSCKQVENTYNVTDPRLDSNRYCNDPEAVNYNWNFPGKPDNTVCVYPADLFKGNFLFNDSVTREDGSLDSVASTKQYLLTIAATGNNRVTLTGFCSQALVLTAPRTGFRALLDTTVGKGQLFCRPADTINGSLQRDLADTVGLRIAFTVISDTGTRVHYGTATRQ
ncbi:MAG: hypothetical protein EOP52_07125 [Sphingobacteriales bacterium]|nr:MAG: hypothetical protein EOP52_07125 [Sphingobacteriales bacterium]